MGEGTYQFPQPRPRVRLLLYAFWVRLLNVLVRLGGRHLVGTGRPRFSCCFQSGAEHAICSPHLSITWAPAGTSSSSCKPSSPAWHLGQHICAEQEPGGRLAIVWLSLSAAHDNDSGPCWFRAVIRQGQALTATFSPPVSGENIGIWVNRLNIETKALVGPLPFTLQSPGSPAFNTLCG